MMTRLLQLIAFIILIIVLRQFGGLESNRPEPDGSTISQPEQARAFVKRVVDGDTLLLEGGERVRLLGVDTPETKKPNTPVQPFGPEASEFTRQLVERKEVTLLFDRERFDQYGRTLAFVYVGDICLNEELIRNGFSRAELQYPFRNDFKRRFSLAEKEARENMRGVWTLPENSASGRRVPGQAPPPRPIRNSSGVLDQSRSLQLQ